MGDNRKIAAKPGRRAPSAYLAGKQDRRRAEIIDAAAAVFAEKGFHEATAKDIADRVGLLPASLYYYFDSKEAALLEICRRRGQDFNARLEEILAAAGPVEAKVRAGITQHLHHNRADLVSTIAFTDRAMPAGVAVELRALGREYERLWERIFRRAVQAGELPPEFDGRAATIALLALCNGAIHWYEKKAEREIDRIAAQFAGYFLHGILPGRTGARSGLDGN